MEGFEDYFRSQLQSPHKLLTLATNYIFRRKGKQLRPLLVFLSAKASGQTCEATYAAATLIELLHNASLVHDDVVDETYTRRGQWSLMGLWDSKVAVLVGDFFLSRGMSVALEGGHYEVLRIVSEAVRNLSEGELQQIEHARRMDMDEETYYDIIRRKTATLIEACTNAGAVSAGADEQTREALTRYGSALGMAFQIRDDIFDYTPGGLIGKPTLNDIKEQKLTLPLIEAMRKATTTERRKLRHEVRLHPQKAQTARLAAEMVDKYDGIEYARESMLRFAQEAKQAIDALKESEAKRSLIDLVDYNTGRTV